MSDSTELLVLRLALIGMVFLFVLLAGVVLRSGLRPRRAAEPAPSRVRGGPRLVVITPGTTGLHPGSEFELAGEMTIGRDGGNGIVLADPSVSGRHAAIMRVGRDWTVSDLGSTNGTLVNGRAVDGRGFPLRGGEKVVFGAVVLRYQP